jgi:short-subunit dehydrogenase
MRSPRSILITGASSGIGEALARAYAAPGTVLSLGGRNADRLAAVATACRDRGATVDAEILDVTDPAATAGWVERRDDAAALDLVIANAGISGGGGSDDEATRRILATNVGGVVNTVSPALARMRRRGRGQIAIVSSITAFRGLPSAPAYSASKAAVKAWGEALRGRHARDGIEVSVICPGFVASRMTRGNPFPMPFVMDADRAAAIIRRRLARNRGRIVFPWPMHAAAWLLGALPSPLTDRLTRNLPRKE